MIRKRRRSTLALYLAGDIVATLLAFLLAWYIRFDLEFPPLTKGMLEFRYYVRLLPLSWCSGPRSSTSTASTRAGATAAGSTKPCSSFSR